MDIQNIQAKILARIREITGQPLAGSDSLIKSGRITSITFVDLLVSLESEFNIAINMFDISLDKFDTADDIAAFIHGRLTSK